MLSGPGQFAENKINEANFREILPNMLWKVCMYFTYKIHYTNNFRNYQIPNRSTQGTPVMLWWQKSNFMTSLFKFFLVCF